MVEREVVVVPEAGLHARPAKEIVKIARSYKSDVTVARNGREANARSLMKLMALGAKKGDSVLVRATGEDEEAAVEALVGLISSEED
ncbi:MAG: HPr family phosphocarrier protein [Actinobacteria bacterium]|nr:HPr family phosphocarrier protein [Actinomycetota bacterium]PLS85404.1 MAG: HPr family phosphocarrier protein [Actinomycetota bacterium]